MKIFLISVLTIVSAHSIFSQSLSGDKWSHVKSAGGGTISIAYVETPGFVYKDRANKLTGICVDIMEDFVLWANETKKVRLEAKYVGDGTNFQAMYNRVKSSSNGVFGLGNITITEERKKQIMFSPPFITNFAILVSNSNTPTLSNLQDISKTFANMTAYTAKGTLNEKRILDIRQRYYKDMKMEYTTTSQETLEKIFSDPNSFAYLDLAFYLEAVQVKKSIKRHPIGDQAAEKFGFIMPQNSDWGPLLDEFFNSSGGYLNSRTYKNILIKHLGETGVKLLSSASK